MMKRILLVIFFGYIFGTIVFGQQPGNNVEFQPLVSFDGVIEKIIESFTNTLARSTVNCFWRIRFFLNYSAIAY